MSLESEIKALTAAVQQLTEMLRNQAQMPLPEPVNGPETQPEVVEQKAVLEVAADNTGTVTVTPVAATLEDCKAAFRVYAKQFETPSDAHKAGAALLAKFGAAKLPELKADDYAAFVAACQP